MKIMISKTLAFFAASLFFCTNFAVADIVVFIGNKNSPTSKYTFVAGQTAVLPVWAYNNSVASVTVTSFGLGLDFSTNPDGYDGLGIPGTPDFFTSLSFTSSAPFTNSFTTLPPLASTPANTNADVRIGGSKSAPGVTFAGGGDLSTAQQLGSISFSITANATPTTYGLKFVPSATLNGASINSFGGQTIVALSSGTGQFLNQFEVEAVPEPSTLVLLGSGIGIFGLRTFSSIRSKRKSKA